MCLFVFQISWRSIIARRSYSGSNFVNIASERYVLNGDETHHVRSAWNLLHTTRLGSRVNMRCVPNFKNHPIFFNLFFFMPFSHFWRFLNAYISLNIYRNHLKFWHEPFLGYICRTPQVRGASVLMTFYLPFNIDLYRALVGKTRFGLLFGPKLIFGILNPLRLLDRHETWYESRHNDCLPIAPSFNSIGTSGLALGPRKV